MALGDGDGAGESVESVPLGDGDGAGESVDGVTGLPVERTGWGDGSEPGDFDGEKVISVPPSNPAPGV